jgi:hypothetical protein
MISQIYISFQTLSLFSSLSPLFSLPILQRSLPGELMLWTMFHEQLDFLGLVSFSPHCSIYSTVVSFLSSIFCCLSRWRRWMVDVGGQMKLLS